MPCYNLCFFPRPLTRRVEEELRTDIRLEGHFEVKSLVLEGVLSLCPQEDTCRLSLCTSWPFSDCLQHLPLLQFPADFSDYWGVMCERQCNTFPWSLVLQKSRQYPAPNTHIKTHLVSVCKQDQQCILSNRRAVHLGQTWERGAILC